MNEKSYIHVTGSEKRVHFVDKLNWKYMLLNPLYSWIKVYQLNFYFRKSEAFFSLHSGQIFSSRVASKRASVLV